MNSKQRKVFEGICDKAAEEWFEYNSASIEAVQDYAENGLGIKLKDLEAGVVLKKCLEYKRQRRELFE